MTGCRRTRRALERSTHRRLASLALLLAAALVLAPGAFAASPASAASGIGPSGGAALVDPATVVPLRSLLDRGVDQLARGDLDAADAIWTQVREIHPDHPAGPYFQVKTLQARRSDDFQNTSYDKSMRKLSKKSLKLSQSWLKRAPRSAEANMWAGLALLELVQLDGMAKKFYRAGTQGEEAREHLELALEVDPTLIDAKLPLGTYYYYASIATKYIRFLTWLWFVPTGEHDLGLAYVEEVARDGDLMRFEARQQLARFYLYMEERPDLAAPLIESLHADYPTNTYLHFEVVELRMSLDDYEGTVRKALELEQGGGSFPGDGIRRIAARIWRARAELFRGNSDEAQQIIEPLEQERESLTPWSRRWLMLTQGNLRDVQGNREQAIELYEEIIANKPTWTSGRSARLAKEGLEGPFRPPGPTMQAPPEGAPASVGAAQ